MIGALINLLIYIVVLALILTIVFWVLKEVAVPEPFNRIIRVVAILIVALIAILLLLQLVGVGGGIDLPKVVSWDVLAAPAKTWG